MRTRIFGVSVALILCTGLASSLYLEPELRGWLVQRIEGRLLDQATSARALLMQMADIDDAESVDPVISTLGSELDSRLTIVRQDGTVVSDSRLSLAQVRQMDNHAERPEIATARKEGCGIAKRFSDTVKREMLYVAIPYRQGAESGTVRAANSLSVIEAAITSLRRILAIAAAIGLAIALATSGVASHLTTRALASVLDAARGGHTARETEPQAPSRPRDRASTISFTEMSTELERAVSTLAEERARFQCALEDMREAVITLDGQRRVVFVNSSAASMLGLPEQVRGRSLVELIRVPDLIRLVNETQDASSGEATFDLPGPPPRHLHAYITGHAADGSLILVLSDLTERRRLETMRRDFVANVSHELRTPITVIRANAENLLDGALSEPDTAPGFVEAILRNSERLSRLIADLLDLSRIEAGDFDVTLNPIALNVAVQHILPSIQTHAGKRGTSLEIDVPPALTVMADQGALEQVLLNLVDNAVKHSPEKSHVRLQAQRFGTRVRIEVQDNGPGIAPEHRERLFERFYRIDPGRSRAMGGTGLGLSIVRNLVAKMEGSVGMRPSEPQGTTFWVELGASGTDET